MLYLSRGIRLVVLMFMLQLNGCVHCRDFVLEQYDRALDYPNWKVKWGHQDQNFYNPSDYYYFLMDYHF